MSPRKNPEEIRKDIESTQEQIKSHERTIAALNRRTERLSDELRASIQAGNTLGDLFDDFGAIHNLDKTVVQNLRNTDKALRDRVSELVLLRAPVERPLKANVIAGNSDDNTELVEELQVGILVEPRLLLDDHWSNYRLPVFEHVFLRTINGAPRKRSGPFQFNWGPIPPLNLPFLPKARFPSDILERYAPRAVIGDRAVKAFLCKEARNPDLGLSIFTFCVEALNDLKVIAN